MEDYIESIKIFIKDLKTVVPKIRVLEKRYPHLNDWIIHLGKDEFSSLNNIGRHTREPVKEAIRGLRPYFKDPTVQQLLLEMNHIFFEMTEITGVQKKGRINRFVGQLFDSLL